MEAEVFSINGNDGILYLLSIAYGFAPPVVGALLAGAKLVMADAASIHRFPELVGEHGVSLVYASPLVYQMILNEGGDRVECLRGARHLVTTGSRLADSLANEFRAKIGHEIVNRYGLNECGMVVNSLVSLSVAELMCDALEEIIQLPSAPNGACPIASLPGEPLPALCRLLLAGVP